MFVLKNVKFKEILDIDYLEIPDDKITLIIGQSGSGKSTLLKLLNILISPDDGEIFYNKKNLNDVDVIRHRREVLMLPQNPTIFNGSILDNFKLAFNYQGKKIPWEEEISKELLNLNLDKSLSEDATKLSGGEKQKLQAARGLLLKPKVILLDEPTSALDRENEDEVIEKIIENANKNNIKLIMVTHSNYLQEKYCDNIIRLSNGRVVK
ncbi:ATP-binding cassette domain-containing protein [Peptoniphilus sp. MSJ-1]|uniref:ATP-binding cassette domain-containing protein n=1 Tax=Peptoniphilus ovalis TaxID=2841503 RepID=A0ABS6FKM9_9FIRM|nr:ATP-binding cassette domain-containing protein [Peptoniphilus ovalis]MBU5670067.1 ATP-binding cassette domain-containing protein [Peptoniphilus ovalis]